MTVPDTRPELREEIHEAAGMIGIHASLVMTYAEICDDCGLAYALRRMVAYVRHASFVFKDLEVLNRQRRAESEAGDAAA